MGIALFGMRAEAVPDACDLGFGSLGENAIATAADAVLTGQARYEGLGTAVANIGDFDGDGVADAAIGIPGDSGNGARAGAVDLYLSGGGAVSFATPSVRLFGAGANDNAGVAVAAAGDVNGDGYGDVLVGAAPTTRSLNRVGVAWLVLGSPNAALAYNLRTQANATFTGVAFGDDFGAAVAGVGDVNGDGFDDVAVGAPGADANGADAGAAFIFYGPLSGTRAANTADRVHTGAESGDRAGFSMVRLGDADEDGFGDYAVGAPSAGPGIASDGAVFIVTDTTPGVTSLADAWVILHGANHERLGWSLAEAGSHNEDAVSELWVGSRSWGGAKRGAVSLIDPAHRPVDGQEQAIGDVALARIHGRTAADFLGTSVAGGVDFNADGYLDVIMGADTAEAVYAQSGAAWVAFGPFSGDTIVSATTGRIAGGGSGALTGASVAAFPDLNGDGFADLIVGSPGANPAGRSTAGAASVLYGGADVLDLKPFYLDADHDGWGGSNTQLACTPSSGFVTVTGDCNDASSSYHPFAPETVCGDLNDYSCDGSVGSVDADNDGVYACANDCADNDPTVAAGLPERCANLKDDDCNGQIDDSLAVDAVDWRPDADQDGFGDDSIAFRACEAPAFFLTPPVAVAGDCADGDFSIKPGAMEVCDEVDNDCNGAVDGADALDAADWYVDADADGYGLLAGRVRACAQPDGTTTVVGDCDDSAASIAPGNAEACDGLDNDCDGWLYLGGPIAADDATWRLQGAVEAERFGQALTAIPDMDADGFDELVVSAPAADGGVVYVLSDPPTSGELAVVRDLAGGQLAVRATIRGAHARGGFGAQVAGGDFDGDGVGDLAIAAPADAVPSLSQGAVYVFYGPLEGDLTSTQAGGVIIGVDGNDRLGTSIAVGDLNNDGADELILGAPGADAGFDRRGAVAVVQGSGARLDPDTPVRLDALQRLVGTADRDELGQSVAVVGDLDGDGLPEVAAGAQLGGASDAGYVMIQTWGGFAEAGLPASVITGAGVAQRLGRTLAGGDVTGDGYADLLVSNALGRVWLVAGQSGGLPSGVVTDLELSELRGATGVDLGAALAVAPDANGDGVDEIVVGAPSDDVRAANGGAVYLIYGDDALPALIQAEQVESFGRVDPGTTFPTYSAANFGTAEGARLQGSLPSGQLGAAILTGFHSSNPGLGDIVAGAPGVQTGVGAVYGWATGAYATDMGSEGHPPGWTTVMPDLDLDGQGDQFAPSISGCPMHAPIRFVNGVPVPASVTEGAPTDCDDANPLVYLGAPDRAGDGIDQNCDGSDGGVDLPPEVTDCHVISSVDGDGVLVTGEQPQGVSTATDPDGDPVTVSYVWTIGEGTIVGSGEVLTEYTVSRGDYIRLRCTPTANGASGAEVSSPPVMVGNAPPWVETCNISPTPINEHHTPYVVPKVTELEGESVTWTFTWTVNGAAVQSGPSAELDPSFTAEGDTLGLTCSASDGLVSGSLSSSTVIGPQPPDEPCDFTTAFIERQADVAYFEHCTTLLQVYVPPNADVTHLELPALTAVSEWVTINQSAALTSVSFPALTSVGTQLNLLDNTQLSAVSAPSLTSVGQQVSIQGNTLLCPSSVDWAAITPTAIVHDNGSCGTPPAPCATTDATITSAADVAAIAHCTSLHELTVQDTATLTSLSLPNLQSAADVYVRRNTGLQTISLPALTSVGNSLHVWGNDALASLDVGALPSVWDLYIGGNPVLSTMDLGAITSVGGTNITNNPSLCVASQATWAAISSLYAFVSGNGACATPPAPCPGTFANIAAPEDVAQYQHCTTLSGLMASSTVGINTLSLPNLETLDGMLYLENNAYMWTVDLPQLTEITGYVYLYNNSIDALLLPSLVSVDGYFFMQSNGSMTTMNADSLAYVGMYTSIRFQPQLCVETVAPWRAVTVNHAADTSDNGSCGVDSDGDGLADLLELIGDFSDPGLVDTDGDGLDDWNEYQYSTNPRSTDTDGDGLADADEYALSSNPTDADTDNDGANDGEEWAESTDPNAPDTDGDGLMDGDEDLWLADPLVDDSDGGGELDGAEVLAGTDPLNPDDDYPPARVLITEVVDHASLPGARFIELYNTGGQDQDLAGWSLLRYDNGEGVPTASIPLTEWGYIPPGGFWVIAASNSATTGFAAAFGEPADQAASALNGDGDDVYVLTDGVGVIDVFGAIGEQPAAGTLWNYAGSVARRAQGIVDPNPTFSLAEWTITGGDTSALPFHRDYTPISACPGQSLYITDQASIEAVWHCTSLNLIYMGNTTNAVSLSLPNLQTLSSYVYLDGNAGLRTIDLPSLTTVPGYFYLTNNLALITMDVSSLTAVQEYTYIANNPSVCVDSLADWVGISAAFAYLSGNGACAVP